MLATVAFKRMPRWIVAQAARLNTDLTPRRRDVPAMSEGSLPSWTGGRGPPANYREGMHHPDPYAEDYCPLSDQP